MPYKKHKQIERKTVQTVKEEKKEKMESRGAERRRLRFERKFKEQPPGNHFQKNIDAMKSVYSAGYESMKEDPHRPPTPVPFSPDFKKNFKEWRKKIMEHLYLEDTEISVQDSKNIIKDMKGRYPYDFYDRYAPKDNEDLRRVQTPEPTETLRGDEWKEIYENWLSDLKVVTSSPDFNQHVQKVNKEQWKMEKKTLERNCQQFQNNIDITKTVYSAGYESMKQDPNRPPTPVPFSPDFVEKYSEWRQKIMDHLYSEDTEISVENCRNMIEDIKQEHPYNFYDKYAPKDDEDRKVKTPEPTETLRGDEWKEMSENWLSELKNHVSTLDFEQYVKTVKKGISRQKREFFKMWNAEKDMTKRQKKITEIQEKLEEEQG